ncbi:mutator type transposase [Tanacetum coccineum]
MVFHNEDGNPARANIKQALGYLKDGEGDGNSQLLKYQDIPHILNLNCPWGLIQAIASVFPSDEHRFQLNNGAEPIFRQLVNGRDQPIITCLEYIKEYFMKRIVVVQKVIAKTIGPLTPSVTTLFDAIKKGYRVHCSIEWRKWELIGIPCKHVVAAIYNMSENSMGVVVESTTVIIPHLYKPKVDRPPKKRNKSHDEIASESCSSGELSRKGKSIKCTGAKNVSGQAAGARNVSGQADGARNASSQSGGSSQPNVAQSITTGTNNASSQVVGAS